MNDLGDNLLRFQKDKKYLIFDTETENLSLLPGLNRPWQISYGIMQNGKLIEKHNRFLWFSDLKMSKDAARITRFDWARYKEKAEDPKKVLEHFEERLYDQSVDSVTHNGFGFDIYIHNGLRKSLGLSQDYSYLARKHDTQNLYKAYKKGFPIDKKDYVLWNFRVSGFFERGFKTNLGHVCREIGVDVDENKQHDALYDITICGAVFRKLIWMIEV